MYRHDRPSIGEVFAFFADAANSTRWRAGVEKITADAPPLVGTVYRQRVAGPGGRTVSADVRITEFEPERKIVLQGISGPLRPIVEYTFEAIDGGTRVTFSLAASLTDLKKLLMAAAVQRTMDAEVAGSSGQDAAGVRRGLIAFDPYGPDRG
ncbi:SRPBCC family protein [Nocardia sp. CA-119907]|uniref:SRPBCC family protein n=1 Tax=Nocardia sp. CA-119907 TaxID=3239973 RepID=UPI003D98E371